MTHTSLLHISFLYTILSLNIPDKGKIQEVEFFFKASSCRWWRSLWWSTLWLLLKKNMHVSSCATKRSVLPVTNLMPDTTFYFCFSAGIQPIGGSIQSQFSQHTAASRPTQFCPGTLPGPVQVRMADMSSMLKYFKGFVLLITWRVTPFCFPFKRDTDLQPVLYPYNVGNKC